MAEKDTPTTGGQREKSTHGIQDATTPGRPSRRRLLHILGAGGLASIAGCSDDGGSGDGTQTGTETGKDGGSDEKLQSSVTIGATAAYFHNYWGLASMTRAFEPLVSYDLEMRVRPWLATEWERTGEDTWEFTLRDNVQYHNGDKLTADRVIARANNWLSEADWVAKPGGINTTAEGISKVDDMTIEMKTIEPDARHYENLVEVKTLGAHPDGPPRQMKKFENLIGTGPFQIDDVKEEEHIKVSAFAEYWGGNPKSSGPHVDTMTVRKFEDRNTAALALTGQDVDVGLELPIGQLEAVKNAQDTKVENQTKSSIAELRLNLQKEPMSDRKFRKALNYAVSQQEIVDGTQNGLAVPARGIMPPMLWWAAYDSLPEYGPDTDKAKQLVEESVYDGRTLQYVTTEESPRSSTLVAELLQQSFKKVGVSMNIETVGSGTWSERISAGDGDIFPNNEWLNFMGEFFSEARRFGSAEGGVYFHGHPTNTPSQEIRDRLDPILEEASTSTGKTYKNHMMKVQQIIAEEALMVPLFHEKYLVGMRTGIEGVKWHPAITSTRTENLKYFE